MLNRKQFAVVGAEFLGTGALALVMLYVQNAVALPYFVALGLGVAMAALVYVFNGSGGNHFNPAITIGLWTVRQIGTLRALSHILVQFFGAWAAYHLYLYLTKQPELPALGTVYNDRYMAAEVLGALVIGLAFSAVTFKNYRNSKAASVLGLATAMAVILASVAYVGGSRMNGLANPALAFSMRAFEFFGPGGLLVYVLGPIIGAVIGTNLFALLFADESSFDRVRGAVSSRLTRSETAPITVNADVPVADSVVVTDGILSPRSGNINKVKGKPGRKPKAMRTRV